MTPLQIGIIGLILLLLLLAGSMPVAFCMALVGVVAVQEPEKAAEPAAGPAPPGCACAASTRAASGTGSRNITG